MTLNLKVDVVRFLMLLKRGESCTRSILSITDLHGDHGMKCRKSDQECNWCDKAYDCQIYQRYCRLERYAAEEGIKILAGVYL
jgi:hypothetical protein